MKKHSEITKEIFNSPFRLFLRLIIAIIFIDVLLMMVIDNLPAMPLYITAFIDSTFLVMLLAPVLYFLIFRPIINYIADRKKVELERQVQSEIVHSVTITADLDELLKLIHCSLRKVLYAENCFFALHDQNTDLFSFPYFIDQFDSAPDPSLMTRSCTLYIFRTGKSLIITPEVFKQLNQQNEVEMVGSTSPSWVGVPLQTSDRVIGVLVLQHYGEEKVYDEENLRFLDSIASQVANVIERKRAEEKLKKSEIRLRELNATKDKFFSIIAHDLRSPFNSIMGFSGLLSEMVREKNYEGLDEFALIIKNASEQAMDLLSNLLEWSQSQSGRIEFKPQNFELVDLINEVIVLLSATSQQKSITIRKETAENSPVFADKAMISAVLRNLISNAIKFTQPGGTITISTRQDGNEWLVAISDNGVGMNKDVMNKLFRIEASYSTEGTQQEKGTGLGLILCKDFIIRHGGEIWAESELGQGSKFYFTIPKRI